MTSTVSSKPASSLRRSAAVAALAGVLLAGALAHAAPADSAIAESLFQQGKELMKKGDYEAACPKLAESQRLDPASGTMLALALCHEKAGKLATAWAQYLEAVALARKDESRERAQAAQKRAADLEPQLAKLAIVVAGATAELPGLSIRFDGVVLEQAVWGTPMPVDAGQHEVAATADGKQPWQATVTIPKDGEQQQIEVGPLADLPPEPVVKAKPAVPIDQGEQEEGGGSLIAGGVLLGVGLAAVGVGTFFGVRALDQIGEAQDRCTPERCTDPEAIELNDDGALAADLSTGLLIGGGVVAATGLILLVTAAVGGSDGAEGDAGDATAILVRPLIGSAGAAISLGGTW